MGVFTSEYYLNLLKQNNSMVISVNNVPTFMHAFVIYTFIEKKF